MKKIFITALFVLMLSFIGCGKTGSPKEIETESIPAELETKTVAKTEKETESIKELNTVKIDKKVDFEYIITNYTEYYNYDFQYYYMDSDGYPYEQYVKSKSNNETYFIVKLVSTWNGSIDFKAKYGTNGYTNIETDRMFNYTTPIDLNIDGTIYNSYILLKNDDPEMLINGDYVDVTSIHKQYILTTPYTHIVIFNVDKELVENANNITLLVTIPSEGNVTSPQEIKLK